MEAPDGLSKGDVSSRSVGAEAASHFVRSLEPEEDQTRGFYHGHGVDGGGDGEGYGREIKETRRRPPRGVHVRDTSVSWHFPLAASHLVARLPTPD